MASVKVAVRVRPFNQREKDMNAKLIVQMDGKKTRLLTVKNSKEQNDGTREKYKDFTFDYSYWSYDHNDPHYASQEQVFSDLGLDVIESAFSGYNACVFAYGQTGSGKTFTMMGSPESQGLIPRICRQLFSRVAAGKEGGASYRTEVSYLEIYNERVKDLLAADAGHSLRVREHPQRGPYVQDLSKHLVSDYDDIQECMQRGNQQRTTASTQMNDVSSRSHAIFTVTFVQASYLPHNNLPSETASKVHLVDLAGSERADATGATGQRLVEGAHINKSLVTLGSVISALAEAAHTDSRNSKSKKVFIPYRDSVLTWLLKDSLGGNSKTIMIAAISPADVNYGETLSTLRYANRAKNIINKPTVNEDPNVKLIRELRQEIDKLRAQIDHNTDPVQMEPAMLATLQRKEAQEKVLTERWTEKWRETQQILHEQKALGLRKSGLGVVLDSDMPHLVGIDDNLLSTGVTLYHLKEGETVIGSAELSPAPDIVIAGAGVLALHSRVTLRDGEATICPAPGAQCWLNTVPLDRPAKLSQGCILLLGRTNMFRYNDPAEAAKLRQEGAHAMNLSRLSLLSWSATDLAASTENLNATLSDLESEIRCDRLSAQRAELERERQQFAAQQEERQRRWRAEREQLRQAQQQLDEERAAMESEYSAACRRLAGDWRALERGWAVRRRALRSRQRELSARARDHKHQAADVAAQSFEASPDSPASETSTECLMHLLRQCEPVAADGITQTVERHKRELDELSRELSGRVAAVAARRVKLERLHADLALLAARQRGLARALAVSECESEVPSSEGMKRSKSELVLRRRDPAPRPPPSDTLSADERDHYRAKRLSLSLSLEPLPLAGSELQSPDTFHTASSSPRQPLSPEEAPTEAPSEGPTEAPSLRGAQSESSLPTPSTTEASALPSDPAPDFRLGPADDSDELSSTEDYNRNRVVEGQSSSSVERSPEERPRARYRRRLEARGRRPATEAEALRAMQRLCTRIAAQKTTVIQSLENDCSKEELNRQIAVLQELQKKYVRLEMALQYSLFERERARAVPPIQETPSLTPSETDPPPANGHAEPLRLGNNQNEVEASDNMSTSADELPTWSDPLRAVGPPRVDTAHAHTHDDDVTEIPPTISNYPVDGLYHPINFADVVCVPGWVTRGAGARTHHEYEVRVRVGRVAWQLLRRYRRFRDLYLGARAIYGDKVAAIPFPGRALWSSEALARARRPQLEQFLVRLLSTCAADARCPLHADPLTRDSLVAFSPFFRKGVFESGKCGTG
ncbi:kinesin-like protein Klp98A isoform X2 [Aricia agestis]|uniref:kinesin-like protein Klp98A isoform X2 n=1 Tax=Aricia agestis TaxID=91739 RepID=UPI001C20451B|nr:kinesin-like protein Klp98A isoform X2 [Aricia agestis]